MSDFIRRQDAIDYFVTNIGVVDADGYAVDDYDERVKIWTERFSGIPSAEPERKKGEWQRRKGSDCWECSECHAYLDNDDICNHNFYYCYHCGAKMTRGE